MASSATMPGTPPPRSTSRRPLEGQCEPEPDRAATASEEDVAENRSRSVTVRRVVFVLLCCAGCGASVAVNESADVAAVLPYILAALVLQFLPVFWPERSDPFSPAALPALLFGPDLVAHLLEMLESGEVDFAYLTGLSASTRVDLLQKVLILLIICSATYLVGFYFGFGRRRIARVFPNVQFTGWSRYRVTLVCVVCGAAFLAAYAFFQSRISAPITDITALREGKAVWRDDPTMSWLGRGVLLGCIPLLLWVTSTARRPKLSRALVVAACCVVMALLTTRLGQRGHALHFGLTCLIVVHYVYRRINLTTLAALGFGAILALSISGDWRTSDVDPTERVSVAGRVLAPAETLSAYSNDRNRIPILATVIYYIPERQDYLWGASYLALLGAPIPKWIWPEKQEVFKWRDTAIAGILHEIPGPVQMQGVLYANFSWLGAGIGMFLWGLFHRGMYEWLLARKGDPSRVLLYSTMLLYLAPSSLAMSMVLQYVVPIWLILMFVKRRQVREQRVLGSRPISAST
jgi:hypothetical protein